MGTEICGARMYACTCGLAPAHKPPHECCAPKLRFGDCGAQWTDDGEIVRLAYAVSLPPVEEAS